MVATISIRASGYGISLNQVFSGQDMAEMIDLIRKGVMKKDKSVYFYIGQQVIYVACCHFSKE